MTVASPVADGPANEVRILVVDDNQNICEDFRKVLSMAFGRADDFSSVERELFGSAAVTSSTHTHELHIDAAPSGRRALELLQESLASNKPYALAFVDFRMPPGWNGIETVGRLWEAYTDLECVLCTAYADLSYRQILRQIRHRDRFLVLKKPFDPVEIVQMTLCLAEKWALRQQAKREAQQMARMLREGSQALEDIQRKADAAVREDLRRTREQMQHIVARLSPGTSSPANDLFGPPAQAAAKRKP